MSDGKIDLSGPAYEVDGMLKACILACDSMTTIDEWNGDNGIERTLMVAERMLGDLIEQIEILETKEYALRKQVAA